MMVNMWSTMTVLLLMMVMSFYHMAAFQHNKISSLMTLSPRNRLLKCRPLSAFRDDIRNVAIIAHVDHGKTTLVDSMIRQSGAFRTNQDIQSMDSNEQEKERGITILAKNAAIMYEGTKINVVDTPGHADFGGEVERIMNMVDGVLLVVDSVDGPKPQTKFVLKKALEKGIKAIVVINKVDRAQARPSYVIDRVFDLFVELNASDEQMDFQIVYSSGLNGQAGLEPEEVTKPGSNLQPLFAEILKLPRAQIDKNHPLQLLIANIDTDEFLGKLGIGRIVNGEISVGDDVVYGKPVVAAAVVENAATTTDAEGGNSNGLVEQQQLQSVQQRQQQQVQYKRSKVAELFVFNNVGREKVQTASAGDIVMVAGLEDVSIGDTVMHKGEGGVGGAATAPLPPITVEQPTVRMTVGVNKSPLAGREGKHVQSRAIRDRLLRELDRNVALQVSDTDKSDTFEICGRGQLHLTVLIETMRREGFELMIGPPTVIEKQDADGKRLEPFEAVDITVPTEYSGAVVDLLNKRKGEMIQMSALDSSVDSTMIQYVVPTRGLVGIRSALLTATRGTVIMDTSFEGYKAHVGAIFSKERGSLLATESGQANMFGLKNAQERGKMFVSSKEDVYKDMIIGVHQRPGDLYVNVCKTKAVTNVRAADSADAVKVVPALELNLDIAVEYISEDELVEVTPTKVRMLKNPNMSGKGGRKQH